MVHFLCIARMPSILYKQELMALSAATIFTEYMIGLSREMESGHVAALSQPQAQHEDLEAE